MVLNKGVEVRTYVKKEGDVRGSPWLSFFKTDSPKGAKGFLFIMKTVAESIHRHSHKECCMCGDFGFLDALFRCRICLFRSQHKYCSDLYPGAESYYVCNWCLRDKDSRPATFCTADDSSASSEVSSDGGLLCLKRKVVGFERRLSVDVQSIKKKRFHGDKNLERERKSGADGKEDHGRRCKKGTMERKSSDFGLKKSVLLRTKSENLSSSKIVAARPIGRGKIRRYKLLEEVAS